MTDKSQVAAVVRDGRNALAFRCEEPQSGRIEVIFASQNYLIQKTPMFSPSLTIRFGKSEPEIAYWNFEDKTAYIRLRKAVRLFVEKAISVDRIVIRSDELGGETTDSVFEIEDAKKAIGIVAKACGDLEIIGVVDK